MIRNTKFYRLYKHTQLFMKQSFMCWSISMWVP